jgi:hypothetical protein
MKTCMRSEVLEAVTITMLVFRAADGGSMFLRNVGIYLLVHMALQPRRTTSI